MSFPDFFDTAPTITVRDPLADFLGAATDGVITYRYADVVRLAGHSCPTVAGAYLMVRAALNALYPDETPERGNITVQMSEPETEGVSGVMAQVFTLVTGATANNGFHGIGGRFARTQLLAYARQPRGTNTARFTRRDTGASVDVRLVMQSLAPSPEFRALLGAALSGQANEQQQQAFRDAWQARVRALLVDHADDTTIVQVQAA